MNFFRGALVIATCILCTLQDTFVSGAIPGIKILRNSQGTLEAHILPTGAIIQKLLAHDNKGNLVDIVLGYDTLEPYLNGTSPYFGTVVGRVVNRISNAQFQLNGTTYSLGANEGKNTLHSGKDGWNKRNFTLNQLTPSTLVASLYSPNGDQGFPGNVNVTVSYSITDDNKFEIEFNATSSQPTPINIAQHSYFNLNGATTGSDILNNLLTINGSFVTPVDQELIPTGKFQAVEGTPYDFLSPHTIGERISQLTFPPPNGGYDINYVLFGLTGPEAKTYADSTCVTPFGLQKAVTVESPITGIKMEILTNAPGVQFYSGNNLQQDVAGKNGTIYPILGAAAFETQVFPNAVNTPEFPQCILMPGKLYNHKLTYSFSSNGESQRVSSFGRRLLKT